MSDFGEFLNLLDNSPFDEYPVDVRTFVTDKGYLGLPPLSDIQYDIVEAMSQIYYLHDLERYMSHADAAKHYDKYTKTEIILKLGKGAGKDHTSTVACAYIVYKLLILKDPSAYYGKPSGDAIDILNVAINAQQAKNVFFKGLKSKVERSPWFRGKFNPKIDSIDFDKAISVYSGHSERESHEGLNIILVVLDEISGFAIDNPSGLEKAKTADAIYNAFRGTVDSRFNMGKVVLLSFPRYDGCFISQQYEKVIAEKHLIHREHTFIVNPELPHDDPENLFTLEWEEDHIQSYKFPGFFAICRPTWEVNPTKSIDDFKIAFVTNEADARTRFLAQPTAVSDAFFGRRDKILSAMVHPNPLTDVMAPTMSLRPLPAKRYYMHADLAQKVDRCAVALSHVDKWVGVEYSTGYKTIQPYIITDAIAYWKPGSGKPIDLKQVKDWIILVRSLGFPIDLITFDRWGCLPEDSLIYTVDGPIPIRDISVGQKVNTRSGAFEVSNKKYSGEQEVFRIKTKLGHELEATGTHRVLTGAGWKTVAELSGNDTMVLSNNLLESGTDYITEEAAYVLGALVADGWYGHSKDQFISFVSADNDFANRVIDGLINEWGFANKVMEQSDAGGRATTYSFWDKKMVARLREKGLDRVTKGEKRIPWSVLKSSRKVVASFLAGYIDGDGGVQSYIDKNNSMRQRLTVDSAYDKLLDQILWAFWYVGAEPTRLRSIRNTHKGPTNTNRLTLEGRKGRRALSVIKPELQRKSNVVVNGKSIKERYIFIDGILELPIKSIESIGVRHTYDISVPGAEEFIAGGFVVHNSLDMQRDLMTLGFKCETLSVAKKHYEDLQVILYEDRLQMPDIDVLYDEMKNLRPVKDRIEHPRTGSGKDLSDALCGSVFNAATRSPRATDVVVEIHDITSHVDDSKYIKDTPIEISTMDDDEFEVFLL